MRREHYIGDEIQRALQLISEESDDWSLRGRSAAEVDYMVEYHGGNYIHVEVQE